MLALAERMVASNEGYQWMTGMISDNNQLMANEARSLVGRSVACPIKPSCARVSWDEPDVAKSCFLDPTLPNQ